MTPDSPRRIPPDAAQILADIDAHVEGIAIRNPAGSDLNELAFAIHNLITAIERLHAEG